MPYATPTVQLCSDLAAAVQSAWNPAAPSAVSWNFVSFWGDADNVSVPKLQGRQVEFFPAEYEWSNENRGQEGYTHSVLARVLERYTDAAGFPSRDWIAQRADFVHAYLVKGLRYTRSGPAPFNKLLMSLGATVDVLDTEKMIGDGKLFCAVVHLRFFELVP